MPLSSTEIWIHHDYMRENKTQKIFEDSGIKLYKPLGMKDRREEDQDSNRKRKLVYIVLSLVLFVLASWGYLNS